RLSALPCPRIPIEARTTRSFAPATRVCARAVVPRPSPAAPRTAVLMKSRRAAISSSLAAPSLAERNGQGKLPVGELLGTIAGVLLVLLAGAGHPRLLLDASRVETLRSRLTTTHAWLWQRYLDDVPRMVAVAERREAV